MPDRLFITGCSQLVTLAGPRRPRSGPELEELGIVTDGALLVQDGVVVAAGPQAELAPLALDATVVDAGGRVVTPGLVDAHAHPVFGGNRCGEYDLRCRGSSYQEIAARGGGIKSSVRATREASEDQLVENGKRFASWLLRNGTTTVEAKSGYGLSVDDELKLLRAIRRLDVVTPLTYVPTFLGAHSVPVEFQGRKSEYVRHVVEDMLPAVAREGLARYCDVFCEAAYFNLDDSRAVLGAAKSLGLGLRMHADQLTKCGGAQLAAELGAVTADHLEQTDLAGIRALKAGGVLPVLLPGSVYALGLTKYPEARTMIDEGLAVVLATDFNPGSSPTPSLPMVMSLACTQMKMTPAEALVAATVNAACSLGLGDRGTLESGKRADFVIWDGADYREIPYWFGVELACEVYVEGERVFGPRS